MTQRQIGGHAAPRPRRRQMAVVMLAITGTVVSSGAGPGWVAQAANPANLSAAASILRSPGAVAVAPDGTVYIADTADSRVVAVGPNGATVVPTSTLNKPLGVAVDGSGNLFIADTYNNRIVEEPAGGGTESVIAAGVAAHGIAVDKQDNVLFTNWPAGIVMTVPASGGVPSAVALAGVDDPASAVGKLYGVAVDDQGDIFGSDVDGGSPAGPSVWEILPDGSTRNVANALKDPHGVATDGQYIYVADSRHNQILKESLSDQTQTTVGTGLNDPWGVALDAAGNVYIADTGNNRVVEVTPAGVQTTINIQFPVVGSSAAPANPPQVGSGSPTGSADAVHDRIGPGETQALSVVGTPNALATADIVTVAGYPRTGVVYRADSHGHFLGEKKTGTRVTEGSRIAYRYNFHLQLYKGRGCALLTFTIPPNGAIGPATAPVKVVSPNGQVTHPGGVLGALFTVVRDPHDKAGSLHPTMPAQLAVVAREACLGQI